MTETKPRRWLAWGWAAVVGVVLALGILVVVVTRPLWSGGDSEAAASLDGIEQRWGFHLPDAPESVEANSTANGPHGDGTTVVVARYRSTAGELIERTQVPTAVATLTDCTDIDEALVGLPAPGITCDSDFLGATGLRLTDGYDHLWVVWLEGRIVVIQATT